jgi:hypothetical protein
MKPLSPKRVAEINKADDEWRNRLLIKTWKKEPEKDWQFRLVLLFVFNPDRSCRSLINHAKTITRGDTL